MLRYHHKVGIIRYGVYFLQKGHFPWTEKLKLLSWGYY